jgi:hypothetical protein
LRPWDRVLIGNNECRHSGDAHFATVGIAFLDHDAVSIAGQKLGNDITVKADHLGNVA